MNFMLFFIFFSYPEWASHNKSKKVLVICTHTIASQTFSYSYSKGLEQIKLTVVLGKYLVFSLQENYHCGRA